MGFASKWSVYMYSEIRDYLIHFFAIKFVKPVISHQSQFAGQSHSIETKSITPNVCI